MIKSWNNTFTVVAVLTVFCLLIYSAALSSALLPYDERFAREFDHAADLGRLATDGLDLTALNDGKWSVACLFGERATPIADLIARGASIAVTKDDGFARLVGSNYFVLGYIDELQNGRFLRVKPDYLWAWNGDVECVTRSEPILRLR